MAESNFHPSYSSSHAIVVGINNYKYAPPLSHATNDANELANVLRDRFGFPAGNICLLLNQEATHEAIREHFLSLTQQGRVAVDDRLLVYFAGHGHTAQGRRGEVGFLVPFDGNTDTLASLIRWDELTRNADLISAKHILFVMDACYGGLAINRALPAGSMRFLKDMLLRVSRQVIAAGKANEVVSDAGGPLPDHSIFTGHLLEALGGKAADTEGIITANGLMSYTYQHVGQDPDSRQTPQYGYLDGEGDFIFTAPQLDELRQDEEKDRDKLITVPSTFQKVEAMTSLSTVDQTKELLSEPKYRIHLYDHVAQQVRGVLSLTSDDNFALGGERFTPEAFTSRLKRYEEITRDLVRVATCISYWGNGSQLESLKMIFSRLTDRLDAKSGLEIWLALRWYPLLLLSYASGIAAIATERYGNLAAIFMTNVRSSQSSSSHIPFVGAISDAILDLERREAFKTIPGHERHYVPRSEYLFKLLQPDLDDVLFLGSEYESNFDKFEVMLALVCAYLRNKDHHSLWGPIGRFGWKFRAVGENNPLSTVLSNAANRKDSWPPIQAGLFNGSYAEFQGVAEQYEQLVRGLPWV